MGFDRQETQRLPLSENQTRNDAFYQPKGRKSSKVLAVKRPRRLSEVLAQTLEGLRMENQDSRAIANYRTKNRPKENGRMEWKKKRVRSMK